MGAHATYMGFVFEFVPSWEHFQQRTHLGTTMDPYGANYNNAFLNSFFTTMSCSRNHRLVDCYLLLRHIDHIFIR